MKIYIVFYLLIAYSVYLLAKKLGNDLFKPYTRLQKKKSDEVLYYDKDDSLSFDNLKRETAKKLPVLGLSDVDREEIQKKIDRLGLDMSPSEVRQTQVLYALVVILIGVLVMAFVKGLVGFIICLVSIYVWKIPIWKIDDEIKKRNEAVIIGLPKLYMVLYYSYKRSTSVNFIDKIQSFMPHTNELFYQELQLLVDDARSGEVYALRQFKKRVPINIVMRFCDIMEARISGYDNLAVMQNFKDELDEQRSLREDKLLKQTSENMEATLSSGVYISIFLLLFAYFFAQFAASFRGLS